MPPEDDPDSPLSPANLAKLQKYTALVDNLWLLTRNMYLDGEKKGVMGDQEQFDSELWGRLEAHLKTQRELLARNPSFTELLDEAIAHVEGVLQFYREHMQPGMAAFSAN